jgi:hypothetical protein
VETSRLWVTRLIQCPRCPETYPDTVPLGYHLRYIHNYTWAEVERYIKKSTTVTVDELLRYNPMDKVK